jgi:hypothetical protein
VCTEGREYLRNVKCPGLMNSPDDTPSERVARAIRQCVLLPIVVLPIAVVGVVVVLIAHR